MPSPSLSSLPSVLRTERAVRLELEIAVREGRAANFGEDRWSAFIEEGRRGPIILGSLVRALVMERTAPSGVQIVGAMIAGDLDLRNARGPDGGSCNALELKDCDLVGADPSVGPAFDACHSHLSRVSLKGCRTTGIHISSAIVDGDLILEGLTGLPGHDECWIRARGVQVKGSVTVSGSRLRVAKDCPPFWADRIAPYALDLRLARISSSLNLRGGFVADGGVTIDNATIDGNLWADGASLMAVDRADKNHRDVAFRGQGVRIHGYVFLGCEPGTANQFRTTGRIDFDSAQIDGRMYLGAAVLTSHGAEGTMPSVNLAGASISGPLYIGPVDVGTVEQPRLIPFQASGKVSLMDATIRGWTHVEGARGLLAIDTTFGSSLDVLDCEGTVELNGSRISANMTIAGGEVPIVGLLCKGAEVGGDVNLSGRISDADFSGMDVKGDLVLGEEDAGMPLELVTNVEGTPPQLKFEAVRVHRDLHVNRIATAARYPITWASGPVRVRTAQLSCFRGWGLIEALFETAVPSEFAIVAFLYKPAEPNPGSDPARLLLLDGDSGPLYEPGDDLLLDTAEQAAEYITFFCGHLWADYGNFQVRPGSLDLIRDPSTGNWRTGGIVEYGSVLFEVVLEIQPSNEVTMLDDSPLAETLGPHVLYASPARIVPSDVSTTEAAVRGWPIEPPPAAGAPWVEVDLGGEDRSILDSLKQPVEMFDRQPALRQWPAGWTIPRINLSSLRVGRLLDDRGKRWLQLDGSEQAQLLLDGFEYESIQAPSQLTKTASARPLSLPPIEPADPDDQSAEESKEHSRRTMIGALTGLRTSAMSLLRSVRDLLKSGVDLRQLRSLISWDATDGARDSNELKWRRIWLNAQYEGSVPTRAEYSPQPYQQLAKVFRSNGDYGHADDITFEKLRIERLAHNHLVVKGWPRLLVLVAANLFALAFLLFQLGVLRDYGLIPVVVVGFFSSILLVLPTKALKKLFFEIPFGYGLRTWSAFLTFAIFLIVGWAAVEFLAPLKLDTSAAGTVVTTSAGQLIPIVQIQAVPVDQQQVEVACDQKDSLLYALDVMLPLDLRQEARCKMSSVDGLTESIWRTAKGLYAVGGWIVVSGLILTVSGVVRRQAEK